MCVGTTRFEVPLCIAKQNGPKRTRVNLFTREDCLLQNSDTAVALFSSPSNKISSTSNFSRDFSFLVPKSPFATHSCAEYLLYIWYSLSLESYYETLQKDLPVLVVSKNFHPFPL
mmetsp:Transcript_27382/g.38712  ORF Transcript_27382/g.38712 Transcript_27382/m.38712 type:complete len:115 (-) Transcript_27382:27-371(-)